MGRQVGGKYVSRQVCKLKLVGRQVDRHARIYWPAPEASYLNN